MNDPSDAGDAGQDLRCPECRAVLKRRRSRSADSCEMICGGCGKTFDVCDAETVADLRNTST